MDLRFRHPFTLVVAGPSSCGKSEFVKKIINSGTRLLDTEFSDILWCYSEWHPSNSEISKNITFQKGLDNISKENTDQPRLIILDDLMGQNESIVADLFTKGSHHNNMSVIYITQNIFHQGKRQRDISINSHYLIFFQKS